MDLAYALVVGGVGVLIGVTIVGNCHRRQPEDLSVDEEKDSDEFSDETGEEEHEDFEEDNEKNNEENNKENNEEDNEKNNEEDNEEEEDKEGSGKGVAFEDPEVSDYLKQHSLAIFNTLNAKLDSEGCEPEKRSETLKATYNEGMELVRKVLNNSGNPSMAKYFGSIVDTMEKQFEQTFQESKSKTE